MLHAAGINISCVLDAFFFIREVGSGTKGRNADINGESTGNNIFPIDSEGFKGNWYTPITKVYDCIILQTGTLPQHDVCVRKVRIERLVQMDLSRLI